MTKPKDGGPAFPETGMDMRNGQQVQAIYQRGMSLRDYFAAKMMQGMVTSPELLQALTRNSSDLERGHAIVARVAYEWSDAMLKERAKAPQALGDCISCDGYVLNADDAPRCPSCARERKEVR